MSDGRELELEGNTYLIGKMATRPSFHVARRLAPLMSALSGATNPDGGVFDVIGTALAKMSNEDTDYILDNCLYACKRKNTVGGWAPVAVVNPSTGKANPMFMDMSAQVELGLAINVIVDNILSFFITSPLQSAVTETATQ